MVHYTVSKTGEVLDKQRGCRGIMLDKIESPCVKCEHKDRDKNSEGCVDCDARLLYAIDAGMLSKDVVRLVAKKGPGRPRTPKKEKKKRKAECAVIHLQADADMDPAKYELLRKVAEIARVEYRTTRSQAFYLLKCGVRDWDNHIGA